MKKNLFVLLLAIACMLFASCATTGGDEEVLITLEPFETEYVFEEVSEKTVKDFVELWATDFESDEKPIVRLENGFKFGYETEHSELFDVLQRRYDMSYDVTVTVEGVKVKVSMQLYKVVQNIKFIKKNIDVNDTVLRFYDIDTKLIDASMKMLMASKNIEAYEQALEQYEKEMAAQEACEAESKSGC